MRTFCVRLVAYVDIVCVVRDEARAPKTAHCFLHQITHTNQRGGSVEAAHAQGRGFISPPQQGLPHAEGERLNEENHVQEVALDIEPGPPGNWMSEMNLRTEATCAQGERNILSQVGGRSSGT